MVPALPLACATRSPMHEDSAQQPDVSTRCNSSFDLPWVDAGTPCVVHRECSQPETYGDAPCGRSDHIATAHQDQLLYVFGGGSATKCFNDLFVLHLPTMTWAVPRCKGTVPV
jgi:hypothetical protein